MRIFHLRTFFIYTFILITLSLLAFESYVFIIFSRDVRMHVFESTMENYEDIFCGRRVQERKPGTKGSRGGGRRAPCPPAGILTTFVHTPLGINMWRYANLVAAAHVTGLGAYVPDCMRESLSLAFSNLSLPLLREIGHCKFPNMSASPTSLPEWVRAEDDQNSIVFSWTDLYTQVVVEHIDKVKEHFVFRKGLVSVADAILGKSRERGQPEEVVFVGVYITKTSQVVAQEYDSRYPSVQFFLDAMDHYRRNYKNPVFIAVVEYPSFWSRRFRSRDVVILDTRTFSTEGTVLSILARCNHSILGFPGVPFWGAILSGGDVITSLSLADDYSNILQAYQNWNYLERNTKSEVFDPKVVSREW